MDSNSQSECRVKIDCSTMCDRSSPHDHACVKGDSGFNEWFGMKIGLMQTAELSDVTLPIQYVYTYIELFER